MAILLLLGICVDPLDFVERLQKKSTRCISTITSKLDQNIKGVVGAKAPHFISTKLPKKLNASWQKLDIGACNRAQKRRKLPQDIVLVEFIDLLPGLFIARRRRVSKHVFNDIHHEARQQVADIAKLIEELYAVEGRGSLNLL